MSSKHCDRCRAMPSVAERCRHSQHTRHNLAKTLSMTPRAWTPFSSCASAQLWYAVGVRSVQHLCNIRLAMFCLALAVHLTRLRHHSSTAFDAETDRVGRVFVGNQSNRYYDCASSIAVSLLFNCFQCKLVIHFICYMLFKSFSFHSFLHFNPKYWYVVWIDTNIERSISRDIELENNLSSAEIG